MVRSKFLSSIFNFISAYTGEILILLMAISIITLFVFISISIKLSKITNRYKDLINGVDGKNLEELLFQQSDMILNVGEELDQISKKLKVLEAESKKSIKKVYSKRYNPFAGVGGDLSFSVALLNEENTGVILTSLYGNEENRIYLKPVEKGKTVYNLSPEESEVVKKAMLNKT